MRIQRVIHRIILRACGRSGKEPAIAIALCFGAMSCTCGAVVAYPLTLVRTRLIAQGMPGRPVVYKGTLDCIQKTIQRGGVRALYGGLVCILSLYLY